MKVYTQKQVDKLLKKKHLLTDEQKADIVASINANPQMRMCVAKGALSQGNMPLVVAALYGNII